MKALIVSEASEMSALVRADIFCSTSQMMSNKTYVCVLQKMHVCMHEDCLGQKKKRFYWY